MVHEWLIVLTLFFNDGHSEIATEPDVYATPLVCQKQALSKEYNEQLVRRFRGKGIGLAEKHCKQFEVKYHES